jgi:4-amino-4-deoxy-L-arabinose transferase-like glycosyltransferase
MSEMSQIVESTPVKQPQRARRTMRDLLVLSALTLALHLPFIGQAFHLDDVQYLDVAQNVYQNPFFPLDLPSVFEGLQLTLWGHTHPPLNSYLIAGLLLFHDRSPSEVFLHSAFLFFPVLVTISFYFLSRRFIQNPFLAAALLATNPTLMVSAHTLMADVPLLGLWLCAAVLFLKGVDENNRSLIYWSGIPITAACFYAYQAFAIIPLLGFYAVGRKRLRGSAILVLGAPIVLMAGWQLSGYLYRGVMYASTMFQYLGERGLWRGGTKLNTAILTLTYLGGIIFPFPFIFARMCRSRKGLAAWIGLALAIVVAYETLAGYTWWQTVFFVACLGGGVAAVIWIVARGFELWSVKNWATDNMFLCVWTIGVLVGSVVAFFSGSARYLLPACPPLLLLLLRADEQRMITFSRARIFYISLLAVQLALGLAMAQSDYEFAGIGRREAQDFQAKYLSNTNQHFLFSGEWGFRYYLTAMGGEIMSERTTGSPGKLVVVSRLCLGRTFDNELGRSLDLVEERTYRIRSPLRLLDEKARAGFWSNGWGVLPFWFSREKFDDLYIYRVREN